MGEWWDDGAEDWQIEILHQYLDEFGEGEMGDRTINLKKSPASHHPTIKS